MTPRNTVAGGSASLCAPPAPMTDRRFTFSVRPLDYARIVHPKGGTGQVAFGGPVPTKKTLPNGKPAMAWGDRRWSPHALATREVDVTGARFMTMGTYRYHERGQDKPARSEANLVALGASWLDLDSYKTEEWADVPPETIREVILNTVEDLGLPRPSYILFSGRGHLVVWLYKAQPWTCIADRWKATQRTLHERFLFLGSDASARTPTKWFRLPGTRNEKTELTVTIPWPHTVAEIEPTTFDRLAAAVLPHARQAKASKAAAKEARAAKRAAALAARKPRLGLHGARLGGRTYWGTLRADLDKLHALRHGAGPVPDGGGRNAWICALAYAAAWDMPARKLDAYVRGQAARCGLDEEEALAKTASIRKRACEAAEGMRKTWKNRRVDPRYRPKPETFVEDLAITAAEMRKADLRMLVDEKRRAANAVARVVKSRRAHGVSSRGTQQDTRLAVGLAAFDMRKEGLTNAEVCEVFDVTARYLDTALRDARAVVAIGTISKPTLTKPKPAPKPVPTPEPQASQEAESVPSKPAHEVLRGTREIEATVEVALVAGFDHAYSSVVTMVGTSLQRGRTPAASPPAQRAFSRLDLAVAGA